MHYQCRAVSQPSPTNENKLIYICDDIKPNDNIKDDLFQFDLKSDDGNIIYLYRECEMYQWKETQSKISNKYTKTWSSTHIDSTTFEDIKSHQNPSNMIQSKLFHTKDFTVSNFVFNLDENESITQPKIAIHSLLKYAKLLKNSEINLNGNKSEIKGDHTKYGWYYFSNNTTNDDINSAEIGDIRVRFWIITQPLSLTVVGNQNGKKIISSNNDIICMRKIGKYKVDNALKKLFHVKLINNETGSIFIMTNIALSCCIYSAELLRPIMLQKDDDPSSQNMDKSAKNEIGIRALIGSTVICGPIYCLSVMYPHIEKIYGKHPTLMNSIGILTVASIVLGGTQRISS